MHYNRGCVISSIDYFTLSSSPEKTKQLGNQNICHNKSFKSLEISITTVKRRKITTYIRRRSIALHKYLLLMRMGFTPRHFHFAGSYVFIETSFPRKVGDKAYLISQPFDPTNSTGRCLKFWHHMKGASIGTLNVYIYTVSFSSMSLLWQRKGNKGNNWMLGQTPIRSSVKYQVRITCLQ